MLPLRRSWLVGSGRSGVVGVEDGQQGSAELLDGAGAGPARQLGDDGVGDLGARGAVVVDHSGQRARGEFGDRAGGDVGVFAVNGALAQGLAPGGQDGVGAGQCGRGADVPTRLAVGDPQGFGEVGAGGARGGGVARAGRGDAGDGCGPVHPGGQCGELGGFGDGHDPVQGAHSGESFVVGEGEVRSGEEFLQCLGGAGERVRDG